MRTFHIMDQLRLSHEPLSSIIPLRLLVKHSVPLQTECPLIVADRIVNRFASRHINIQNNTIYSHLVSNIGNLQLVRTANLTARRARPFFLTLDHCSLDSCMATVHVTCSLTPKYDDRRIANQEDKLDICIKGGKVVI